MMKWKETEMEKPPPCHAYESMAYTGPEVGRLGQGWSHLRALFSADPASTSVLSSQQIRPGEGRMIYQRCFHLRALFSADHA